jgi:hypothetical protein
MKFGFCGEVATVAQWKRGGTLSGQPRGKLVVQGASGSWEHRRVGGAWVNIFWAEIKRAAVKGSNEEQASFTVQGLTWRVGGCWACMAG